MRLLVRGFSHHVTGKSVLHGFVSVSDAADTGIVGHRRRFVSIEKENRFEASFAPSLRFGCHLTWVLQRLFLSALY